MLTLQNICLEDSFLGNQPESSDTHTKARQDILKALQHWHDDHGDHLLMVNSAAESNQGCEMVLSASSDS